MVLTGIANSGASAHGGIALRDSGTGKVIVLEYRFSDESFYIENYSSATSYDATRSTNAVRVTGPVVHLKIEDNNTNRISSASVDGQSWVQLETVARTDYATPDQIGFYGNVANSLDSHMNVLSFSAA
jgi:hypothetical protein